MSRLISKRERANYGAELKGFSHTQLQNVRGLKGSTFGAANKGRKLSPEERRAVERKMREDGKL